MMKRLMLAAFLSVFLCVLAAIAYIQQSEAYVIDWGSADTHVYILYEKSPYVPWVSTTGPVNFSFSVLPEYGTTDPSGTVMIRMTYTGEMSWHDAALNKRPWYTLDFDWANYSYMEGITGGNDIWMQSSLEYGLRTSFDDPPPTYMLFNNANPVSVFKVYEDSRGDGGWQFEVAVDREVELGALYSWTMEQNALISGTYDGTGTSWISSHMDVAVRVLSVEPPPATVPEPATIFLLGSGCLGVVGMIRRRKYQH